MEKNNGNNELSPERGEKREPFRLGEWDVHPQLNRITGPGGSHLLEPKLMDLLVELASRPGRVFSRDELLSRVWNDVIVGEEVLTRGISELRRLLADDSRKPRYIETIRKSGYRIIADCRPIPPSAPDTGATGTERAGAADAIVLSPRDLRRFLAWAFPVAVILVAGIWALTHVLGGDGAADESGPWQPRPLTSYPGNEVTPALSPDGRLVAFSWSGPEDDNYDIYVLQIGDASPLRLTEEPSVDIHPVWSPDGMRLAYISDKGPGAEIRVVPVLGGPSRRLLAAPLGLGGGFSWSPDGGSIVYATRPSTDSPNRLHVLDVKTGETRVLAASPHSGWGDIEPEYSPDGRSVAFIRCRASGAMDILMVPAGGGEARSVREGFYQVVGLDWTRDSSELLCPAWYNGSFSLWRIDAESGAVVWSSVLGDWIHTPAVARHADRMVYHEYRGETNIWRIVLADPEHPVDEPVVVSTHWDDDPGVSPDNRFLAFTSTRSGALELWVSPVDGSVPRQVTDFGEGLVFGPVWSPDSRYIAFNASLEGKRAVYIAEPDGGQPRRLDTTIDNPMVSSWANDGSCLYLSAETDGRWDIWRVDPENPSDSTVTRIAARNAIRGVESEDGYFYYSRPYRAGLWRVPLSAEGRAEPAPGETAPWLPDLPQLEYWDSWTICDDRVFLLVFEERRTSLVRYDSDSRQPVEVAALPDPDTGSVSLSRDCNTFYFARTEREHGDLMIVEGFH